MGKTEKETWERIVTVSPAFDKLGEIPNYGISACRVRFILKGPLGVVQFVIGTSWHVPSARAHMLTFAHNDEWYREGKFFKPKGWDVGYHSPKPMYDDQPSMECDLMPEGKCYYDGSGLRADEWIEDFIAGGTDWLWPKLEEEYRDLFESEESK